jgi:hypothetical protein
MLVSRLFTVCCNHFQVLQQTLQEISVTEGNLHVIWQNKDQEASNLDKNLREQTIKLQRAEKQLHKAMREIKGIDQTQPVPLEVVSLCFHILNTLHALGITVNIPLLVRSLGY